jgi:hypothetical protein
MRVIGIDAGSKGGLVEISWTQFTTPQVSRTLVMPWCTEDEDEPKQLSMCTLRDWINAGAGELEVITLEKIHYMPGDAMRAYGIMKLLEGCSRIAGMCEVLYPEQYKPVRPKDWQKCILGDVAHARLEVPRGTPLAEVRKLKARHRATHVKETKAAIVKWCAVSYPAADLKAPRGRTPHEGLVDALAIAHYGLVQLAK